MSRLVTLSALTCTRKFCKCPGLLGNTSTVTMNNEVGRSLAVVRWSLQLLRSWLLKLMSSPLSTASSCLQVQPNGMPWWNCRDGWLQRSTRTKVNWPVSMVVYFTQHLVYSWLPTQVWGGNAGRHWKLLNLCGTQTAWNKPRGAGQFTVNQVWMTGSGAYCSVLQPSSIRGLATPWTYFLHLSLSSIILTDSSTGSPDVVHPGHHRLR